jgi:hypothetical protein
VAASTGAVGGPPPVLALVDLTTGNVSEFDGLPGPPPFGAGTVNGIAVDSDDGIACTTTELDFRVEFLQPEEENRVCGSAVGSDGSGPERIGCGIRLGA